MITWDDVLVHYADLDGVSTDAQTDILGIVAEVVAVAGFGGDGTYRAKLARVHFAAHMGEKWRQENDPTAEAGEVVTETIGASSITLEYAQQSLVPGNVEELLSTAGGRAFRAMARASVHGLGLIPRGRC